ncbi:hypothetical protein M1M34_gp105 [Haloarcula tailed virus 2]|uniref:Uncharacterized protein n=1 Tax=Haloarcula tailed virus 2 TaxID=2877989 RepID=A0AAE9BYK7_9CAUD|nr:hypothetical protein M1M34_gp105 [Haloarcula tailed virus 2]UBF23228.1 hypothetical protein HATV-2_gp77 [Haloarcula tailed virus 2]
MANAYIEIETTVYNENGDILRQEVSECDETCVELSTKPLDTGTYRVVNKVTDVRVEQ